MDPITSYIAVITLILLILPPTRSWLLNSRPFKDGLLHDMYKDAFITAGEFDSDHIKRNEVLGFWGRILAFLVATSLTVITVTAIGTVLFMASKGLFILSLVLIALFSVPNPISGPHTT